MEKAKYVPGTVSDDGGSSVMTEASVSEAQSMDSDGGGVMVKA